MTFWSSAESERTVTRISSLCFKAANNHGGREGGEPFRGERLKNRDEYREQERDPRECNRATIKQHHPIRKITCKQGYVEVRGRGARVGGWEGAARETSACHSLGSNVDVVGLLDSQHALNNLWVSGRGDRDTDRKKQANNQYLLACQHTYTSDDKSKEKIKTDRDTPQGVTSAEASKTSPLRKRATPIREKEQRGQPGDGATGDLQFWSV
jgi:hypothetical protein